MSHEANSRSDLSLQARELPRPDLQDLDKLAARIRDAHKAFLVATANALAAALDAGDAVLALQRELQDRGIGWQAWFRDWGYLPLSTAKLYAQLAAHRDKIEAARAENPEFSLRAARRLISKSQSTTESCQDEPPQVSEEVLQQRAAAAERIRGMSGNKARDDIGSASISKSVRETACIEDLREERRRLEIENVGLRSELEEVKATLDPGAWSKASSPEREYFLDNIDRCELLAAVPKAWALEGHMLRAVSNAKLLSELERRLPAKLWKKHQAALKAIIAALDPPDQHTGPTLDLEAIPITDGTMVKH
jgi:hypothetical protein